MSQDPNENGVRIDDQDDQLDDEATARLNLPAKFPDNELEEGLQQLVAGPGGKIAFGRGVAAVPTSAKYDPSTVLMPENEMKRTTQEALRDFRERNASKPVPATVPDPATMAASTNPFGSGPIPPQSELPAPLFNGPEMHASLARAQERLREEHGQSGVATPSSGQEPRKPQRTMVLDPSRIGASEWQRQATMWCSIALLLWFAGGFMALVVMKIAGAHPQVTLALFGLWLGISVIAIIIAILKPIPALPGPLRQTFDALRKKE